ncbi:MAG TPA: hypothetical protein VGN88_01015 [Phycisphaerae bacterium]
MPTDLDEFAQLLLIFAPLTAIWILPGAFLVAFTTPAQRHRKIHLALCLSAACMLFIFRIATTYLQILEHTGAGPGGFTGSSLLIDSVSTAAQLLQLFLLAAAFMAIRRFALFMRSPWLVPLTIPCLALCALVALHAVLNYAFSVYGFIVTGAGWLSVSITSPLQLLLEITSGPLIWLQLFINFLFWTLTALLGRRAVQDAYE